MCLLFEGKWMIDVIITYLTICMTLEYHQLVAPLAPIAILNLSRTNCAATSETLSVNKLQAEARLSYPAQVSIILWTLPSPFSQIFKRSSRGSLGKRMNVSPGATDAMLYDPHHAPSVLVSFHLQEGGELTHRSR
jgi:hypothetical protein